MVNQMKEALHNSERTRFVKGVALGLTVLALVGLSMWVFRDSVKTSTAEQVADVAKRSLADSDVQQQVNSLSQEVVQRILTDPTVLNTALQFTTRLLHEPSTQTALSNLLSSLLQDPVTLQRAHVFSAQLVQTLTASPAVQRLTADLVRGAIELPENRAHLIALMQSVLNDEKSLAELRRVGSASAHDVLSDAAVREHATLFVKSVLADSTLQQTAGEALWGAVRYSFRPKWSGNGKAEAPNGVGALSPAVPLAPAAPVAAPPTAGALPAAMSVLAEALPSTVPGAGTASPASATPGATLPTPSSPAALDSGAAVSAPPSPSPARAPSSPPQPRASRREQNSPTASPAESTTRAGLLVPPFAVASADELELMPTLNITVNHHAQ